MRRILLLGMAVLLGMVALPIYGQTVDSDEEIIFEESFYDSMGDFTEEIDMGSSIWAHNSYNHCVYSLTRMSTTSVAKLVSPIIDLSNYHNVKVSFDHRYAGSMIGEFWIRRVGGNWEKLTVNYELVNASGFYSSGYTLIEKYQGSQIQLGFSAYSHRYVTSSWNVKNLKVIGKSGQDPTEIIEINHFSDLNTLQEGQKVKLILDDVELIRVVRNYQFIKDGTARIIWTPQCKSDAIQPWKKYQGYLIGYYTKESSIPELIGVYSSLEATDIEHEDIPDEMREYPRITEAQYWDYLGEIVTMTFRNPSVIVCNNIENYNVEPSVSTTFGDYKVSQKGILFPTKDGTMRIISYNGDTKPTITLCDDFQGEILPIEAERYVIEREFEVGKWHTISVPFSFDYTNKSPSETAKLARFVSCVDGILNFESTGTIEAGHPYLFAPARKDVYFYETLPVVTTTINDAGGEYNFIGTFNPVQPADGTYYLTENNTIKPLASGGTIKAFRAYFEPATPNAAHARAICIDGMTTAIEDIVGGEELLGIPQKIYTVGGQYVGNNLDALPKGVYLVNGKKIIK